MEKTIEERTKQLASIQGGLSDYAKGVIVKCCMQIATEQKQIDDEELGKALLYCTNQTTERVKKETVERAWRWIELYRNMDIHWTMEQLRVHFFKTMEG